MNKIYKNISIQKYLSLLLFLFMAPLLPLEAQISDKVSESKQNNKRNTPSKVSQEQKAFPKQTSFSEENKQSMINETWLGNAILLKGIFSYSQYYFDYIDNNDKDAFGIGVEHTSRFTKTQELVLSIEESRLKNDFDYQYAILRGYTFGWRYHFPFFIYKNSFSVFSTIYWGVYDLWAHNFTPRLRTGAWSFDIGNRFLIKNRFIVQITFGLRTLQFYFPDRETNKEWMDSFVMQFVLGVHYLYWN